MPGPIVVGDASVAGGILRLLYRRALGEQLGGCKAYPVTATADGGEARRRIISTAFRDDEEDRGRLKNRWVYATSGDEAGHQARILRTGFHGGGGIAEISRPFAAPIQEGSEFELSWPLPSEQYLDIHGLNQCVNWALEHCDIEYRLALTGNGTESYSLLAYEDYVDQGARVDSIWDTQNASSATAQEERSPYPLRIEGSGAERTLILGRTYTTSEDFQVRVIRRGHTLIKSGGAWGSSTSGLTSDDQAAAVPVPWVVAFGMVRALQVLADLIEQDESISDATRVRRLAINARERRKWAGAAVEIAETAFPQPTDPVSSSMLWTPQVSGLSENLQGSGTSLPVPTLP